MRGEGGFMQIVKGGAVRVASPARPRNGALANRDDPEYVALVATQAEVDLGVAEFAVGGQGGVPIAEGEGVVPTHEAFDIVHMGHVERLEP